METKEGRTTKAEKARRRKTGVDYVINTIMETLATVNVVSFMYARSAAVITLRSALFARKIRRID